MTYFDHPQLFEPPPPPPAPPAPPRRSTPLLTALVVLSVVALLGGIAVGRVTAHSSSNSSQFVTTPGFANSVANSTNDAGANRAAGKVSPAVININTTLSGGAAAGTGMIISSSGDAVTNNHVIDGATSVSVELSNGSKHDADVVGYDASDDVALIHIKGVSGLPTINAGTSDVSVGDAVIALGNALGRGGAPSVVTGSVTDVHQTITAADDSGANSETLRDVIQTDAAIQPGDSGGPLANRNGQVIGMDAAASTSRGFGFRQTSGAEGYAIPISRALSIAHQIADGHGSSTVHIGTRGIMGVALQSSSNSSNDGGGFGFGNSDGSGGSSTSGAVVGQVESGSPADHAGIQQGDSITSVAGHSVSSADDLSNEMDNHHPGDRVSVSWTDSSANIHHATVTLEAGPPA